MKSRSAEVARLPPATTCLDVLISTSFADIFKENFLKTGVLTIEQMTVDLVAQAVAYGAVQAQFQVNSVTKMST